MEDDNVSSPAEGVTPDDNEAIEAGQAEDGDDTDAGTEALDAEAGDAGSEEGDGDDAEGDDASGEGDGDEVEEIELNFGGEKFSVPKGASVEEVAPRLSEFAKNLEAGYTKKFQEVSDIRKETEAAQASVKRMQELSGEALSRFADGLSLQREIGELEQINMDQLWQSNPDQARRVTDEIARKRAALQKTVAEVSKAEAEAAETQKADIARRVQEGKAKIERMSPGFEKDLPDVIAYAAENLGVDKAAAEAEYALNPAMAIAVRESMLYRRMKAAQQTQGAGKQKPVKAPVPSKPLKGKGGPSTPDISRMSEAQMAKHLGLPG